MSKTTTTTLPSTAASSALGLGTIIGKDRSSPLNMPLSAATSVGGAGIGSSAVTGRSGAGVPVLIESGSYSKWRNLSIFSLNVPVYELFYSS